MSPRRARDAKIRNSRPLKQVTLATRKLPEKGTKIRIIHTNEHIDKLGHIREIIERHGLEVEFYNTDEAIQ